MKFTTREGSTAAYGNLFRIESVIFVTSLQDSVSKRKEEQNNQRKPQKSFASVLEQACEEKQDKEISYTANGYTKHGVAYHTLEKRREYV